jgi:hypothetical protein
MFPIWEGFGTVLMMGFHRCWASMLCRLDYFLGFLKTCLVFSVKHYKSYYLR